MTEAEVQALEAGRRIGYQNVELAIMREYEPALKAGDTKRLEDLKTAARIVRELFGDYLVAGQAPL